MEEILNKIIEIDNNAKAIIKEENDKRINIEEEIEEEFNTQKVVIDLEYKDEITKEYYRINKTLQYKPEYESEYES